MIIRYSCIATLVRLNVLIISCAPVSLQGHMIRKFDKTESSCPDMGSLRRGLLLWYI